MARTFMIRLVVAGVRSGRPNLGFCRANGGPCPQQATDSGVARLRVLLIDAPSQSWAPSGRTGQGKPVAPLAQAPNLRASSPSAPEPSHGGGDAALSVMLCWSLASRQAVEERMTQT